MINLLFIYKKLKKMATEIRPEYKCTQDELYSITETIIDNLAAELPAFAAYKGKYTVGFVSGLKTERDAAMALPSMDARDDGSETLRVEMLPFAQECLKSFQFLKGYIEDAFAKDLWGIKFDAAGFNKYRSAAKDNWEELVGMNTAMNAFIAANSVALLANANMPVGFAASMTAASADFGAKYALFKVARQTSVATNAKIDANNVLFRAVMAVCSDAQERVFMDDDVKKKLFTWKDVKFLVSPPGSASLKVTVMGDASNMPIGGAVVTIATEGSPAIVVNTDASGVALFEKIDPADYGVSVVAPSYVTVNSLKEVNTGVQARREFRLVVA